MHTIHRIGPKQIGRVAPLLLTLACSAGGVGPGTTATGGDKGSPGSGGSNANSGGLSGGTGGGGVGTGGGNVGSGGSGTGGASASGSGGAGAGPNGSGGGIASGGNGTGTGGGGSGSGGRAAAGGSGVGGDVAAGGAGGGTAGGPTKASVISALTLANDYFMKKWPDPGTAIDSSHPSNIWTRAVYFEGLMALYGVDPQQRYYDYAVNWGTSHSWGINGGTSTTSADNQCAGQTYIDLYNIDKQAARIKDIKTTMDNTLSSTAMMDWSWVDAIQMAMPVYTKLGVQSGNTAYFTKMYGLYSYTKNTFGAAGLYSKTDHLWWRDGDFDPPYTGKNGKTCYWSRGNGWVYTALARVLDVLPTTDAHRAEYLADFVAMSDALRAIQRSDGFWNVSLFDPNEYGGKETTGTSLFTYGMAMGVRKGWIADATYRPVVLKAWNGLVTDSLHTNGFLGWVQGTGKQPSDGQPVTADSVPNYDDFGTGCFLLGGSEVAKLATP